MRKMIAATAIAAALLVQATGAFASGVELTDQAKDAIRAKLTEQGYEVGKIKVEDGMYEAYAKKDGKKLEVLLDENYEIVRTQDGD
ncbi:MAG: PepSY domain-containing protein [Geminicoccaceae bacterium]|nr:PepSY domain-containing protein [Geminicoccaceae bacterium]